MNNKEPQVTIEDELVAVRILSAVFVTFMVLIVGSYSDTPQNNMALSSANHAKPQVIQSTTANFNQLISKKSSLKAEIPALIALK